MLVQREPVRAIWSYELDPYRVGEALEKTLPHLAGDVEVILERFIINAGTATKTQAPWSLEVIGIVKYLTRRLSCGEAIMQNQSSAFSLVDNAMLKRAGFWYRGGGGHANAAFKHALYRLVQTGLKDREILGLDE